MVADLARCGWVRKVENSESGIVVGVVEQTIANIRIVGADDLIIRWTFGSELLHLDGVGRIGDIDDVDRALPASELLITVHVPLVCPGAVNPLVETQG